jgi:coenzyme F420-reducing hydrogenase delta subunit
MTLSDHEPKIVCFSCKFGWGYLADPKVLSLHVKNWIPIICAGKIDATDIINAFNKGADGVLILGCPEGDCHYQDGNFEAKRRVYLLHKVLESYGIEKERLKIALAIDPEGKRIPQLVKEMGESIKTLGSVSKMGATS